MKYFMEKDEFSNRFKELTINIDKRLLEMVSFSYLRKVLKVHERKVDDHIEMYT